MTPSHLIWPRCTRFIANNCQSDRPRPSECMRAHQRHVVRSSRRNRGSATCTVLGSINIRAGERLDIVALLGEERQPSNYNVRSLRGQGRGAPEWLVARAALSFMQRRGMCTNVCPLMYGQLVTRQHLRATSNCDCRLNSSAT
jgi:hypothetical protein